MPNYGIKNMVLYTILHHQEMLTQYMRLFSFYQSNIMILHVDAPLDVKYCFEGWGTVRVWKLVSHRSWLCMRFTKNVVFPCLALFVFSGRVSQIPLQFSDCKKKQTLSGIGLYFVCETEVSSPNSRSETRCNRPTLRYINEQTEHIGTASKLVATSIT